MELIDKVNDLDDSQLEELIKQGGGIEGAVRIITSGKRYEPVRKEILRRVVSGGITRPQGINLNRFRYTVDQLREAFDSAGCWSDIYRSLKITVCDHNKKAIVNFANYHGIEVPSFSAEEMRAAYQRGRSRNEWTFDQIFCIDSKYPRSGVRQASVRWNIIPQYACSVCAMLPEWNGIPLMLELDHINGVHNDNRVDNLRWVCPNCHSQTHTFKGKNKVKKKS